MPQGVLGGVTNWGKEGDDEGVSHPSSTIIKNTPPSSTYVAVHSEPSLIIVVITPFPPSKVTQVIPVRILLVQLEVSLCLPSPSTSITVESSWGPSMMRRQRSSDKGGGIRDKEEEEALSQTLCRLLTAS